MKEKIKTVLVCVMCIVIVLGILIYISNNIDKSIEANLIITDR